MLRELAIALVGIGCAGEASPPERPTDLVEDSNTPCVDGTDCANGEICTGPVGCDGVWRCVQPSSPTCTEVAFVLCLCDGTTVISHDPSCGGAQVDHVGPCLFEP